MRKKQRSGPGTPADAPLNLPAAVEVVVHHDGTNVKAGTLYTHHRRGVESATFVYADSWLQAPFGYALDPALPLVAGPHHTVQAQKMFRAFADSAPDRWGRRMISRAARLRAESFGSPPPMLSEATFLLAVRDDLRQGAIRFREPNSGSYLADEKTGVPALAELPQLLALADKVEQDDVTLEELKLLLRAGSSLGGARPKSHVIDGNGRLSIAKFPSSNTDTWNVMAWEKTALDLARTAGINVSESTLLTIAGRHVLVIERFDRLDSSQARVGYTSALTKLELNDGDTGSYLEIAAAIEEQSPQTSVDLEELWRRIAFSILISNTDDHLRNHGFLYAGSQSWQLSPAFDLNPDPSPGRKHLATAIADPSDTRASAAELLDVAPYFRLGSDSARMILQQISTAVSQWRKVASRHGLDNKDLEFMRPAFEHPEAEIIREYLQHERW